MRMRCAGKVACSEDLKADRGAAAPFNQQTSENIWHYKNQTIVHRTLMPKLLHWPCYGYRHLMWIKWPNCEKWEYVSYILYRGSTQFLPFLEQPSPYFVCICANIILQFSCLKHPDTRDQFLFAFDPFLLFVLYQRDERLERVISLKSTNLKIPLFWSSCKSFEQCHGKTSQKEMCWISASPLNFSQSNTGKWFLLSDELYVLSDRKYWPRRSSQSELWPAAIEISICVLSTISIRIPLVSPASELTPDQDSTGRETFPQVPLNYSNIQYQWHVTKRHPGQLEARISWAKAGFRRGRVERPLY